MRLAFPVADDAAIRRLLRLAGLPQGLRAPPPRGDALATRIPVAAAASALGARAVPAIPAAASSVLRSALELALSEGCDHLWIVRRRGFADEAATDAGLASVRDEVDSTGGCLLSDGGDDLPLARFPLSLAA